MSEPDDTTYALLFPLVNVKSVGGKFDDDAFTAGYEVGGIGQRLAMQMAIGCLPYTVTIRRDNLTQIDLIAMHFELVLTEVEWADDIEGGVKTEWAQISIDHPRVEAEANGDDR
jgi:hypothetical protein